MPTKRSSISQKSNKQIYVTLTDEEQKMFLKSKSLIQEDLANAGLISKNENISISQAVRSMILFYAKEKKVA
jgi:hypothetical protein